MGRLFQGFESALAVLFSKEAIMPWLAGVGLAVLDALLPAPGNRPAAIAAIALVIIDMITGIAASARSGKAIESSKAGRTLSKLMAYAAVVAVAGSSTYIVGLTGLQAPLVTLVLGVVIATESLSILENVAALGVTLPTPLKRILRGYLDDEKNRNGQGGA